MKTDIKKISETVDKVLDSDILSKNKHTTSSVLKYANLI